MDKRHISRLRHISFKDILSIAVFIFAAFILVQMVLPDGSDNSNAPVPEASPTNGLMANHQPVADDSDPSSVFFPAATKIKPESSIKGRPLPPSYYKLQKARTEILEKKEEEPPPEDPNPPALPPTPKVP